MTTKRTKGSKTVLISHRKKPTIQRALAVVPKAKQAKIEKVDTELKRIAISLNERDKMIRGTMKSLTKEVVQSGKELLEAQRLHAAKGQKGKGFKLWIEKNCPFSVMTAYNYVRLYQASQRRPALLEAKLTEAYIQAGLKKAATKVLPRPTHTDEPEDPPIIDVPVTAVDVGNSGDYHAIPIEPAAGWQIDMRVSADKAQECGKSDVAALLKAVKAALEQFFKAFRAQPVVKAE